MAHPIAIADQAVRLFFAEWFNGMRPSLRLSTKQDGSILVTSEVSSFSAEYQETPYPVINATQCKRRRRSGKSARLRRNINRQADSQPSPSDQNESSLSNYSSNSSSRDKMQIEPTNNLPSEMMIQPTPSCTEDFPSSSNNQLPIFCIRHENGCQNVITSYYAKYTAICDDCLEFLENKLKTTPFCHSLCPCCHHPSGGSPLSFCSECLIDLENDGWIETGWGSWHLDRRLGKIVCISLDF